MTARWLLCILFVWVGMLLPAMESDDALPETVAMVDGYPITRDAVTRRLRNSGELSPEDSQENRRAAIRRATENEIYFYLLGRLLAEEKIIPSEEAAALQLAELERALPHGLSALNQIDLKRLAASENYRWNVALQEYLRRVAPEIIAVGDAELERVYRVNQNQFRLPEQYQLGVIRILKSSPDALDRAKTVRSRLQQGEDFNRVAAEVDPEGSAFDETNLLELLRQGDPTLPAGSISRILEDAAAYYLVKVHSKTPGRFIPFAEAAPYLRLQLVSEKTATALRTILTGELKKAKTQFFIP